MQLNIEGREERPKPSHADSINVLENITEELINHVLESISHDVHRALRLGYFPDNKYDIWKKKFVDIADPLDDPLSHIIKKEDGCKDYEDDDWDTWSDNGSVSWSETESDIDYGCSCEKDESVNLSEKELEVCTNFYTTEHTSRLRVYRATISEEDGDSEMRQVDICNEFNGFMDYREKIMNDKEEYDKLDEFSYRNNMLVNGFSGHGNRLVNRHVNGHMNRYNEHVNHKFGSGYDDKDGDKVDIKDDNKCFNKDGDKGHNKEGDKVDSKDNNKCFNKDGDKGHNKDGDKGHNKDGDKGHK
ncbi:hypothetical protein TNIN_29451 [Trichonephila inaurata madagascariensis]|uniref:Uncharacterized protein n=1 Tax=Trichonephila inaurata madagascariensis TaxID=2747483 RepID=A0A8X6YGK3_9ARAC|nr:hypothetical protein TNIN_29451 [Trichonephila inaurata madagascariensis]